MYKLGKNSLKRLKGVNSDLVLIVVRAIQITKVDFAVIEGVRTPERQKELYEEGATKTLSSNHLTGNAVDLAPWVEGQIPWKDREAFKAVAEAMLKAGSELGISIRWGGDWDRDGDSGDETFYDGPHFELIRTTTRRL